MPFATSGFIITPEPGVCETSSSPTTASYEYDPLGRRRAKIVNGVTTRYASDGAEEIEERDASQVVLRKYVYGAGIDDRIAMLDASCAGGGRCFYLTNWQGSATTLVNQDGTLNGVYHYGPYGEGTNWTPSDALTGNPFRYTGRRVDPETGLYYYRARHYSPKTGRFLQTDPIGTKDDLNLYEYAAADPLNKMDPTGEWVWVAVGVAVNAALQAASEYRHGTLNSWQGAARVATAAAAGAVGGGAAGAIGRQVVGRGLVAITVRAGANSTVGAAVGAAQTEANSRIQSGGRTGATREQLLSSAQQGAAFAAGGSAAGDLVGSVAFRAAGGEAGEARAVAADAERLVQGQGMPGGNVPGAGSYALGPTSVVPPSQVGEVIGQASSAAVSATQPPATPNCSRQQGAGCR